MIEIERHDEVTVVRLVHGKANAIDVALFSALAARLEEERGSAARAIVLTGHGSMFSAGVDLLQVLDGGPNYVRSFIGVLHTTLETVFTFDKPIVAAINGHAIAGGCVLACAADHRIMSGGRIGIPELLVGVPFPTLALEVMRSAVGAERLGALAFGGATYTPAEALAQQLVDALVEPAELMDAAIAAARRLGALAPEAFALTKRQLRAQALDRVRVDAARFELLVQECWASPATHARIRAYVEKTFKPAR